MASRRTRIKAIATIPQRRKTLNPPLTTEETPQTAPEVSQNDERNLNVEHDQIGETAPTPVETSPVTNGGPVFRRKFVKPTVSLNAINRKPREVEEVKNNKIVILNDVIINPAPVINSEQNQLKSPEVREEGALTFPEPPPSPTKISRGRIKAVPKLGGFRNSNYSASESEDESRKNYRHRNDSVCSSTSGFQDSIPECPSPQKPKEFSSVIQRKCRRTEQSRKLAEARRDFYLKFGHKKPDRQKLTMIDLIFYNPVTNPMSDNKTKRKISEVTEEEKEVEPENEKIDDPGSDEENEMPAPQIKIGPQGELVVDEQSLVIENKSLKKNREELEKSELVNGDFETGYGVYKRAKRSKDWSKRETLKFYKALNTIGTDFTLMCELFPRRSRRELKMKFKKEERINKNLVDRAIMQPCGFDFNEFKHEVDMEEKELEEIEKQKERERELKKEAKKRKSEQKSKEAEKSCEPKRKKRNLDIMDVLEDSDADDEVEENEDAVLESLQKPTRSGRVPKILDRYRAPESPPRLDKAKPGSLIVVAGTGPNGQPVYKVCMVTGEHGRKQIGQDMSSLQKALECKENGIQDLFTLSAEISECNETIPAEENNVTIPAEEE
ncbi:transcription factor TFIIIB component B'' homolog [Tribolium castaneum]|uniref:transcription factor TFIIIB component B'' homolog n=1 Tax=Tribolium castaneum TaxID=7070 RepID=UPI0030FEFDF1